ncbi:hypothetical protein GQ55_9G218100 [Panicum hallii var. hallii]|uniref:Uncharacterized protein n=1 Tax=Panicum hallii var. hallii TaxID=1504633 RepID=A0A2T7C5T4_9POAL|nr:hypothetical protein GQ55_9G218100 [Panicum hallii var. hallii]
MQLTCGASVGAGRRRRPRRYPPPPPAPAFNPAPRRLCLQDLAPPRLQPPASSAASARVTGGPHSSASSWIPAATRSSALSWTLPTASRTIASPCGRTRATAGTCSASAMGASSSLTARVTGSSCGIRHRRPALRSPPHRSSLSRGSSSATARCFALPASKTTRSTASATRPPSGYS